MQLKLRSKLVLSFVTVIVLTGSVPAAVGLYLIGTGVVREAQNKVTLDLNSAQQLYAQRLQRIETLLSFTTMRRFSVIELLKQRNLPRLVDEDRRADQLAVAGRVYVRHSATDRRRGAG